jgi:hypothetical protein
MPNPNVDHHATRSTKESEPSTHALGGQALDQVLLVFYAAVARVWLGSPNRLPVARVPHVPHHNTRPLGCGKIGKVAVRFGPKSSHRTRRAATAISLVCNFSEMTASHCRDTMKTPMDYRRKGASDYWITWVCRRCVSQPPPGLVVSVATRVEPLRGGQ